MRLWHRHLHASMKAKRQPQEPKARKTNGEKRLRHASKMAKRKRPFVREGRSLDDDLDERAWLDW
jgi:hypothetical protein